MAGISLTAGMRSNLFNLQSTAKLMEQTAIRLNTGKKVNSALDDPTSYFTARSHMSRVGDLATLKNGMSEGIQTIAAANNGITSIMSLIEDAKAKASSAKSAEVGSNADTLTLTLNGVEAGDVITIGGELYTASAAADTENAFLVNTGDYDNEITAMNLAEQINSEIEADGDITATVSGATITLSSAGSTDMDLTTVDVALADSLKFTEAVVAATGDEVAELVSQYATLMSQIDSLQSDAAYKGINLLDSDDTLTVNFEGTAKLDVDGFDGSRSGLGLAKTSTSTSSSTAWGNDTDIDTDIALLDAAINTLESKASSLASSTSIVTTRQDFTSNMINTLTTGADALTLADMNEEGANMLMLQTQQALGTNSLSMAAQTAQSVLRLF